MTILETRNILVYDFVNLDEETKYGFRIKFEEQDDIYTPYLTNSRAAIGLFIDPIEFAELIQDNGSKYIVTPNAIVFEDAESADIAADVLIEVLRKISIGDVEKLLYDFAKSNHFGKKQWFLDQLRQPNQCSGSDAPSVILDAAYELYTTIADGVLWATVSGGNEDKTYRVVSYNLTTGDLETDENRTIHVRDVSNFYNDQPISSIEMPVDFGSWYNAELACTN